MSAAELFQELARCGADVWADGGNLKVRAPHGLPSTLASRLRESKASMLEALARQAEAIELVRNNPKVAAETREVSIESPWGRVWVVPERTGQDRVEVTWRELHDDPVATLARCRSLWDAVRVFEGRIVAGGFL